MADEKQEHSFGMLKTETVDDGLEDESTDDGVLFYVNKSGFPIDKFTWERMWSHVSKLHPDGSSITKQIKGRKILQEVPIPRPPVDFPPHYTIDEKLQSIQDYMNLLQYNHTGTQFFEIRKNRPISGLMESAKEMIREALPIKCLESVILSVYLTNDMTSLDRFPVSFKTVFNGNTFRHVVCGIYSYGRYGALGMSRRKDLMYKRLDYKSLSDLILDYIAAYKRYFHDVKKVKVGLPISHDSHSYEGIIWKALTVTPKKHKREEMCRDIDRHARDMRHLTRRLDGLKCTYSIAADKPRSITESPRKAAMVKDILKKSKRKNHQPTTASATVQRDAQIEKQDTQTEKQDIETVKQDAQTDQSEDEPELKPIVSNNYQIRV